MCQARHKSALLPAYALPQAPPGYALAAGPRDGPFGVEVIKAVGSRQQPLLFLGTACMAATAPAIGCPAAVSVGSLLARPVLVRPQPRSCPETAARFERPVPAASTIGHRGRSGQPQDGPTHIARVVVRSMLPGIARGQAATIGQQRLRDGFGFGDGFALSGCIGRSHPVAGCLSHNVIQVSVLRERADVHTETFRLLALAPTNR